ncbi:MAG: PrsW family intramembrane metalloprotease [Oscillospiraceae bacterium]|nr:PrsW family intramembrane metalloprotease [Oscillospiraceae bacterium]
MLILLAVLPGIVLFYIVWKHDKIEKEPGSLLLRLFILGALTTISAMLIGTLGGYFVKDLFEENSLIYLIIDNFLLTALVEEGGKYVVMKKTTWRHPAFNYTFDAVLYAVTASLGFAVVENIFYVIDGDVSTALMRAVLSVPGHAIDGLFMGYYYGMAKAAASDGDARAMKAGLKKALWVPVLLHGFYDFCLSFESEIFTIVFFAFELVITVIAIKRLKTASRTDTPV